MRCLFKALFSEGRSAGRETTNGKSRPLRRSGVVADIVLDTGCTRTLVHDRLVPVGQRTKGVIIIRCAHGDEVTYPIAEVEISDIPSGPPFAGWAHNFHDRPAYPLTLLQNPHCKVDLAY